MVGRELQRSFTILVLTREALLDGGHERFPVVAPMSEFAFDASVVEIGEEVFEIKAAVLLEVA